MIACGNMIDVILITVSLIPHRQCSPEGGDDVIMLLTENQPIPAVTSWSPWQGLPGVTNGPVRQW